MSRWGGSGTVDHQDQRGRQTPSRNIGMAFAEGKVLPKQQQEEEKAAGVAKKPEPPSVTK